LRVDRCKNQTCDKHWKIDFAHTFKLESITPLGNHGIVRLVKYCFSLDKNANFRTPLKMSIRRAIFGFTSVIMCVKLKLLYSKLFILIKKSFEQCSDNFQSNEENLSFSNNFILGGNIFLSSSGSYKTSHNECGLSSNPSNVW